MTDQNISVAKNRPILLKRLLRFFSENNQSRREINVFLNKIAVSGDVLLFGGCLRDIALFGVKEFRSDIDVVFCGDFKTLKETLNDWPSELNKYGGFRIKLGSWDIDIWSIFDTWAFRNELVAYVDYTSLLKTTIANWDAILFSWRTKEIYCCDHYFSDLQAGYLDIVLEKNPNTIGALVKLLRTVLLKRTSYLSPRLSSFFARNLTIYSHDEILGKEREVYRTQYMNERFLRHVEDQSALNADSLLAVEVDRFYQTKKLI